MSWDLIHLHGLVEGVPEGIELDAGQRVVGADLPDHEIGLDIGHHAAQALGRARRRSRPAARGPPPPTSTSGSERSSAVSSFIG